MSPLLAAAIDWMESQGGGQGHFPLPVDGLHLLRSFQRVMEGNHKVYRPTLCIVLQGGKDIAVGDRRLQYGPMQALVVSMDVPACGRIVEASAGEPFVGIVLDFDIAMMREVLSQFDPPPTPGPDAAPSLFIAHIDEDLADCFLRLIRMAQTPKAIPVLQASALREVYYRLLSGPYGAEFCKLAQPDTHLDRIAHAIRLMREDFAKTLRIGELAAAARMSPSSFHQHFKTLTSMTPLQFQKQLRLLEARRLMQSQSATVAQAAYQVGYESPSQFSREYSRMFGVPPKRSLAIPLAAAA